MYNAEKTNIGMKYVNKETMYQKLNNLGGCDAKPGTWDDGWDSAISVAIDMLDNILCEDVRPVIHARWAICCDGYYPYCSNCCFKPEIGKMTKYCPSCGAVMDKEK